MLCSGISRRVCVAGVWALLVGCVSVARGEDLPPVVSEAVINAPVQRVWAAFTTKDGIASWMAPHAEIDLRVGGKMLTNYNAAGSIGDPGTIENTILSFEPLRMLSIKATKPPESFPFRKSIESMWSVVYFEPLPGDRTRVRAVGMGYGTDEESQKLRAFFERGNALTLQSLQRKFGGGAARAVDDGTKDADRILALLGALAGGEWIVENKQPDGGVFRSRSQWALGPDGRSIVARGWLGDADGMTPHGASQIWREPPVSAGEVMRVRFQNIDENGALSRGEIRLLDEKSTEWDWDVTGLTGRTMRLHVLIRVESKNEYRLIVSRRPADEASGAELIEMVNVVFRRVQDLPAEFQKMKPSRADDSAAR
jgi:uncharacterized protein YndB with AHSA1/START domain